MASTLRDILQPPPIPKRKGRLVTAKRELDAAVKEKLAQETAEAVKARQRAYMQKPEVKARQRAYMQKPEVKARKRAYTQKPEVKARQRAYMAKYFSKPEVKARQRAHRIEERIEVLKARLLAARKEEDGADEDCAHDMEAVRYALDEPCLGAAVTGEDDERTN